MKLLLLEDELMLQSAICEYLEGLGHIVYGVSEGDCAKALLEEMAFDILILDINVPHIDGFTLMEWLNQREIYTPVIFISAMVDIDEISRAFRMGACDYLKKPFHLQELWLRIDRIRTQMQIQQQQHLILSPNYSYSTDEKILYYYNRAQTLTKKQSLILELLCHNIDIVVPFTKFRSFVWSDDPVDNATIRAEISRLRRILNEDFIENVKGIGYKVVRYRDF